MHENEKKILDLEAQLDDLRSLLSEKDEKFKVLVSEFEERTTKVEENHQKLLAEHKDLGNEAQRLADRLQPIAVFEKLAPILAPAITPFLDRVNAQIDVQIERERLVTLIAAKASNVDLASAAAPTVTAQTVNVAGDNGDVVKRILDAVEAAANS